MRHPPKKGPKSVQLLGSITGRNSSLPQRPFSNISRHLSSSLHVSQRDWMSASSSTNTSWPVTSFSHRSFIIHLRLEIWPLRAHRGGGGSHPIAYYLRPPPPCPGEGLLLGHLEPDFPVRQVRGDEAAPAQVHFEGAALGSSCGIGCPTRVESQLDRVRAG